VIISLTNRSNAEIESSISTKRMMSGIVLKCKHEESFEIRKVIKSHC